MDARALLLTALLGTGAAVASGTAAAQDTPDDGPRKYRDDQGRYCWQDDSSRMRSGPRWICEDREGRREYPRVRPRLQGERSR
ncbi:MAG: hypothetical protein M3Y87_09200 [Myxococcota bacterium]|nr:hypothetical protein [Myxococcota bacterium]